jgi:hypothetical protein
MAILRIDGDSSGAEKAIEDAARALEELNLQAKRTKIAPDSAGVKRLEGDVRSLEAAGRILGGRMGEITGILGDFNDIAQAGISPMGLMAGAIAGIGVAAVGTVAGMVALTRNAIELNRETGVVDQRLNEAAIAMAAVSDSATQLAIEVGSATAPAVTELSYALIGLTEASLDAAKSMGTGASEGLGFALGKTLDVMRQKNVAVALLAGGLDMLAERGREAAAAVGGITNPNDTLTGTAMMQALGLVATNEEEKAYFAEREQRQKDAAAEREREREKALRAEIEQRTREAQEFAAGAEQYRQVWREAYKGRLADADALWEAQQQDSADAIALISAESKASDEAWGEQQDRLAQEAEAAKDLANKWAQSYAMQRDAAQTSADAAIELLGTLLGESKEAAILMLALRKAQAIAEIVINTQVASSAALALGPAAPPAIAAIQAAGVAQIATVAATGIAEGIGIAASGQQGAQNQTFNLVVDSRAVRGGVRQHGTAGRRPAGQR